MPDISTAVSPKVHYRKTGMGPVLVLLHGFPESGELWRNVSQELERSFTLIIPDLPGSGNSVLAQDTSISDMAACLLAILDHEGIEKAIIAGHSMGGYVACTFAAAYPRYVAGLSLVHSTPQADDDEKKKMRGKTIDLILNGGKEVFIRQMIPNLFSPAFKEAHGEVVEYETRQSMKMSSEGMINFYRAMQLRPDSADMLETLPFPVQWVMGADDNVIPYHKLSDLCHKSEVNFVSFYKDCGHMSMFEMPGRLVNDLREFGNYCNNTVMK